MRKALLVFQSDFTRKEGAVCAMYGVVKRVDRDLEILTGTHEIPRYDIWSASCRLDRGSQKILLTGYSLVFLFPCVFIRSIV